MPDPPAITVCGLGKRYHVWTHSRPTSVSDRVEQLFGRIGLARRQRPEPRPHHREEIWALRDVSFDVHRGEVLGVIGPNGAGKSTLLSILARITEPTEGRVEIEGRVSSILEVGTGFHQELSGRDNVFLNGAVLGMTRAETQEKFDEIVDFAGVREFIDMPVKRYSSGMYLRLAFAVAAHLDPDVLLLDEVLAVGDRSFQEKCLRRVKEIVESGRTVVFVSHDVTSVARLCQRAVVIGDGGVVFSGPVMDAINRYITMASLDGGPVAVRREGSGEARIHGVEVIGKGEAIATGEPFRICVSVEVVAEVSAPHVELALEIGPVTGGKYVELTAEVPVADRGGRVTAICHVEGLPLRPGEWRLAASLSGTGELIDRWPRALDFSLLPNADEGGGMSGLRAGSSPVVARHRWEVVQEADTVVANTEALRSDSVQ